MKYHQLHLFLITSTIILNGCGGKNSNKENFPSSIPNYIIFASNRPRNEGNYDPQDYDIYLYDLRIKSLVPLPEVNSNQIEFGPSITADGKLIVFSVGPLYAGANSDIRLYDRERKRFIDLPNLNSPYGEAAPSISLDGRYIAFSSDRQNPGTHDIDVYLYDRQLQSLLLLPGLNAPKYINGNITYFFDGAPNISASARYIVFCSDRLSIGNEDIFLYDRQKQSLVPLPGLNSPASDCFPSISADGRFIVFDSNRSGNSDIYLYDRQSNSLVPLPGLNTEHNEAFPSISPDGRFIAFVSDRPGVGSDDIYLYDRQTLSLVPLPGINSPYFDVVPVIR
jgi:Tol biopolymer transport system component